MRLKEYQQSMSEAELVDSIIELAQGLGWMVVHFRPARTEKGYRTALQGNKGFPDLVLTNGVKLLFAECKSAKGELTAEQEEWIRQLRSSLVRTRSGVQIWRPENWYNGDIERVLRSV